MMPTIADIEQQMALVRAENLQLRQQLADTAALLADARKTVDARVAAAVREANKDIDRQIREAQQVMHARIKGCGHLCIEAPNVDGGHCRGCEREAKVRNETIAATVDDCFERENKWRDTHRVDVTAAYRLGLKDAFEEARDTLTAMPKGSPEHEAVLGVCNRIDGLPKTTGSPKDEHRRGWNAAIDAAVDACERSSDDRAAFWSTNNAGVRDMISGAIAALRKGE